MRILQYEPKLLKDWNSFIESSKNGTFMLNRDYMDYHSDHFTDNSLMFYDDDKLAAIMPASLHGNELRSHGGLTYGGIITDKKMTAQKMLEIFSSLKEYLKENNISKLIYKRVPSIYYTYPSDEDLYALFINDAKLIRRDISTTIDLYDPIKFNERRRRNIKKAQNASVIVEETDNVEVYIDLLNSALQEQHKTRSVHTATELIKLKQLFPNNIRLFAALFEKQMIAGSIIFETNNVAHTQYLASNNIGREIGALDIVIGHLMTYYSFSKRYLDFGVSTEQEGRYLNDGLISQKQEFGGRAIAYDFYELSA